MEELYYALVDSNNIVQQVNVISAGIDPNTWEITKQMALEIGGRWLETSHNTKSGNLYAEDGTVIGPGYRGNYAGIGYQYREDIDAFIPSSPYPSWILNTETYSWQAPVSMPVDGEVYYWDESIGNWIKVVPPFESESSST